MRDDKSYISENHLTTGLASLSRFYLDNNQSWLGIFSPIWSPASLVMICKTLQGKKWKIIDTVVLLLLLQGGVTSLFLFQPHHMVIWRIFIILSMRTMINTMRCQSSVPPGSSPPNWILWLMRVKQSGFPALSQGKRSSRKLQCLNKKKLYTSHGHGSVCETNRGPKTQIGPPWLNILHNNLLNHMMAFKIYD